MSEGAARVARLLFPHVKDSPGNATESFWLPGSGSQQCWERLIHASHYFGKKFSGPLVNPSQRDADPVCTSANAAWLPRCPGEPSGWTPMERGSESGPKHLKYASPLAQSVDPSLSGQES